MEKWLTEAEIEAERQKWMNISDAEFDAILMRQLEAQAKYYKRKYGFDLNAFLEAESK